MGGTVFDDEGCSVECVYLDKYEILNIVVNNTGMLWDENNA